MKVQTKQPGILLKGWFKYIIIKPSADNQEFETNPEFAKESTTVSGAEREQTDDVGYVNIPDEKSFYMVLTQNSLNILSSRRNQITKTLDVIDLNGINRITQDSDAEGNLVYRGGIDYMGDFDEGKCIKLKLKNGFS